MPTTIDSQILRGDSPEAWGRLVDALGPASMLVCIRDRMSAELLRDVTPEDIWQETLLHVWRDRERCQWHGLRAFRRWVLGVAENRIRNAVDARRAKKRGGAAQRRSLSSANTIPPTLVHSTTPSRIASDRERAEAMRAALDSLPDELREVVRLRLFEELNVAETSERIGIGASAVKHRLRKGAAIYAQQLQRRFGDRSTSTP